MNLIKKISTNINSFIINTLQIMKPIKMDIKKNSSKVIFILMPKLDKEFLTIIQCINRNIIIGWVISLFLFYPKVNLDTTQNFFRLGQNKHSRKISCYIFLDYHLHNQLLNQCKNYVSFKKNSV